MNATGYPGLRAFLAADPQGKVVAGSVPAGVGLDLQGHHYFRDTLSSDATVVSDLIREVVSGSPIFAVARCMRSAGGKPTGIVVAMIDPSRLDEDITGYIKISNPLKSSISLSEIRRGGKGCGHELSYVYRDGCTPRLDNESMGSKFSICIPRKSSILGSVEEVRV